MSSGCRTVTRALTNGNIVCMAISSDLPLTRSWDAGKQDPGGVVLMRPTETRFEKCRSRRPVRRWAVSGSSRKFEPGEITYGLATPHLETYGPQKCRPSFSFKKSQRTDSSNSQSPTQLKHNPVENKCVDKCSDPSFDKKIYRGKFPKLEQKINQGNRGWDECSDRLSLWKKNHRWQIYRALITYWSRIESQEKIKRKR